MHRYGMSCILVLVMEFFLYELNFYIDSIRKDQHGVLHHSFSDFLGDVFLGLSLNEIKA